ncbi:hypothetical protein COE50_22330 [Bacillus anthracis]|nr:hypothetical protein COE50_22330 [Bacillus anthracis]
MTQQFNRGQLLDKAIKGEIKKGDKFKNGHGAVMEFDGRYFRWNTTRDIVEMSVMNGLEMFTKFEEKIKLELTQDEVNTLALLMGYTSQHEREEKFKNQYDGKIKSICGGGTGHALYHKLYKLVK